MRNFNTYLDNLIQEAKLLNKPLGKSIPRNLMIGTEQPDQVSFTTEIGGSVKFLVDITNPFRTHSENRTDPTIQPTIVHSN